MSELTDMAEKFANKYRGKIRNFTAKELLLCLQEFEAYQAKLREITLFCELSFAANMTLPEAQALHDNRAGLRTTSTTCRSSTTKP